MNVPVAIRRIPIVMLFALLAALAWPALASGETTGAPSDASQTLANATTVSAIGQPAAMARPPLVLPRDINATVLSCKLRLDRAFFSPALVDDNPSDARYRKALRAFQEAHDLKADGVAGPVTSESLGRVGPLTKEYVLEQKLFDELGSIPEDWRAKARLARMGYETVLEAVAERYHTSEDFLRRLNPGLRWDKVTSGAAVVVPWIVRPRPDFRAARVEVCIADKAVRVYDEEGRLRAFVNCSIGTDKKVYKGLSLTIANVAEWPNYTLNPQILGLTDKLTGKLILPAGPNNLVGRAWTGLSRPGYGIHGTPDPEKIGQTESHGCIRLPNWDALSFSHMARIGAPVDFVATPVPPKPPTAATAGNTTDALGRPARPKGAPLGEAATTTPSQAHQAH